MTNKEITQQSRLPINLADIRRQFDARTYARAQTIAAGDGIIALGWDTTDGTLLGLVLGTAVDPYSVSILVEDGTFDNYCSCPVGFDCKHAAACLIAAAMDAGAGEQMAAPSAETPIKGSEPAKTSVQAWVKQLISAQDQSTRGTSLYRDPGDGCLLYDLVPESDAGNRPPRLFLNIFKSRLGQKGIYTKGRQYRIDTYGHFHGREASRIDHELIDMVRVMVMHSAVRTVFDIPSPYPLVGGLGHLILDKLLTTNRLFFNGQRETPLRRGEQRRLQLDWSRDALSDKMELTVLVDGLDNWLLIPVDPPWYLDIDSEVAGPLQTSIKADVLKIMMSAPALTGTEAQSVANELSLALPPDAMPLPAEPDVHRVDAGLQPLVSIRALDGSPAIENWVVACLMAYGEHRFAVQLRPEGALSHVLEEHGRTAVITREHEREYGFYREFIYQLPDFEPCLARDPKRFSLAEYQPTRRDAPGRWEAFERLFRVLPRLEEAGFTVEIDPTVSVDVQQVSALSLHAADNGAGWFELGLALEHAGHRYDLMPLIIDWLQRTGGKSALRWQGIDGTWLEAPAALLEPVVETLGELLQEKDSSGSLKLSRGRALVLSHLRDELDEAGVDTQWHGTDVLFQMAEQLRSFGSEQRDSLASAVAPEHLNAELRAYQLQGMGWLNFLAKAGLNGILADDMGLGKTVQTLAHLQSLVEQTARKHKKNRHGPFLIVAPTSLLGNWEREAQRFTPALTVRVWHGSERHDLPLAYETATIVVTSYALALRDLDVLNEHGFTHLILDEAQNIRNPLAKVTQALKSLPIPNRLCLTGTPLENHLGELWSLFDFLMPGMLGSRERFSRHFRTPIEKQGNTARQQRLNAVVQPLMLRRRKEQVASELPLKTEIIREVELSNGQARLYESIRLAMQKKVKKLLEERGLARSHIVMLDALLKLRQTCCHPQLVKVASARKVTESAKTDAALEMIEELVEEGRKILVFSQFTEMLSLLEIELVKRHIAHVKLTGQTRKRDVVIDAFQNGDVPVFLISLKAGGTGLNLTAADTVIHYDPWWNPAVERQATDRAHRIGQDKPVFVYKLVAKGTVEEKIVAMQARKQQLADATVERDEAAGPSALSSDDLLALFEPD